MASGVVFKVKKQPRLPPKAKAQREMQATESKELVSREPLNFKQERLDVYQRVTNQIIEAIEQGVDAWQMPWHRHVTMPRNALTGKSYRGVRGCLRSFRHPFLAEHRVPPD